MCKVQSMNISHSVAIQLASVLSRKNQVGRPKVVIANTIKGKGVSIVENNPDWHFKMPYRRELKVFMEELDITEEDLENAKKHWDYIIGAGERYVQPARNDADLILNGKTNMDYFFQILEYLHAITNNFEE